MLISLTVYYVVLNLAALFFMFYDKQMARYNRRRIPESHLIGVAMLGGGLGVLLWMFLFRHKTRKLKFQALFPLAFLLHLALILYLSVR